MIQFTGILGSVMNGLFGVAVVDHLPVGRERHRRPTPEIYIYIYINNMFTNNKQHRYIYVYKQPAGEIVHIDGERQYLLPRHLFDFFRATSRNFLFDSYRCERMQPNNIAVAKSGGNRSGA